MVAARDERQQLVELALGRIFRMGSRHFQPGDIEEYERCREIVMDAVQPTRFAEGYVIDKQPEYTVNYARQHNSGAQGG